MTTTNNEEWETILERDLMYRDDDGMLRFKQDGGVAVKHLILRERSAVRRETEQKIRKFLEESSTWDNDYIYLRKAMLLQHFDEKFTNLDTLNHEPTEGISK